MLSPKVSRIPALNPKLELTSLQEKGIVIRTNVKFWLITCLKFRKTTLIRTEINHIILFYIVFFFNRHYNFKNECVTRRLVQMQDAFFRALPHWCQNEHYFRYNYGCVDLHRERMTLVGPQARAWRSACNGKRWPCAELFSVVSEEYRCHMRCLSCMMHVRLVGHAKKEKQQLDMSVCVQTNESKARCVCGKMSGGGEIFPRLSFSLAWPRVWVLQSEAETHRWAVVSLSVSPLTLLFTVLYSQFSSYEFSSI